jgi:non-homologous end joining protein Ku
VAPRAYWKGFLKLSLVSCPIALFPATSEREKISFHQLNRETGNRIKYRKVDAETGDEVEQAAIVKGYEVDKGQYIELDPEELEAVAIESKRTIEIDEFVPKSEIDELYMRDPYYIVPDGEVGQQAFAVIREAIRKEGMVALGKVVFTSREHIIALEARATPTRSATRTNISTPSRTRRCRRTCSISRSTSSAPSAANSSRKSSRTNTRMRSRSSYARSRRARRSSGPTNRCGQTS